MENVVSYVELDKFPRLFTSLDDNNYIQESFVTDRGYRRKMRRSYTEPMELYGVKNSMIKRFLKVLKFNMIKKKRLDLKNYDFTIISSNCIGGVISHKLGLRFMSPTVNLFIEPSSFVKFCKNLTYYFEQPLEEKE